jgi:hypothetical protein
MKAMRDYLRKLDNLSPAPDAAWHHTLCNVIYMQFLGFESARLAILDLVEFEPRQAEDLISILLSELPAYRVLLDHFDDDFRRRRLVLREPDYQRDVPSLYRTVMAGTGKIWEKAQDTAGELAERYQAVFGLPISSQACAARSGMRSRRRSCPSAATTIPETTGAAASASSAIALLPLASRISPNA